MSYKEFLETIEWANCLDADYDKLHYIIHMPVGLDEDKLDDALKYAMKLCGDDLALHDHSIISGHLQNSSDPVFHILVAYNDETEVEEKHFYYSYKFSEFTLLKKFYRS